MNDAKALCPQCRNEVTFEKQGRTARCPVCGFQYQLIGRTADMTGATHPVIAHENGMTQSMLQQKG